MRRSFYHYLMTLKGPAKDPETDFANEAAKDIQFQNKPRIIMNFLLI